MQFFLLILIFLLILGDTWLIALSLRRDSARRIPHDDSPAVHIPADENFGSFVKEVCNACADNCRRTDVEIMYAPDQSETAVTFDCERLSALLTHLFANALSLLPDGGIVRIETRTSASSVAVSMAAEAPGSLPIILSAELPAVTASLSNGALHPATEDTAAEAYSIPEAIGCTTVENPAPDSDIDTPADAKEERKPEILVVTADPESADLLTEGLSPHFNVTTAEHDGATTGLSQSFSPDIILADSTLLHAPHLESVPLVLLTDKQGDEATVQTLTSGADDYITVPVDMEQTILTIKRLVGIAHNSSHPLISPERGNYDIPPLDDTLLEKAVKYVVTNIRRTDLSVEELSAHLGMSRVHLYKKLKAATGKTPIEFIRLIRMKRGAQMLRGSRKNISEIAFLLGYNTPKIFSRYFKEEFGVLPSVYQS